MAPLRSAGTPGQVAIRAIQSGDDMLLMSPDVPVTTRRAPTTAAKTA
jgi:hypothetical protein